MVSRLSVIAIDAVAPERVAQFWCDVLGWRVLERDGDLISIGSGDHRGPTIDVLKVPEAKQVKNRVHLDLASREGDRDDEIERVRGLGATELADLRGRHGPGSGWVVFADPEGNEFCVVRSSGEKESATS